jgi:hypothetical protein
MDRARGLSVDATVRRMSGTGAVESTGVLLAMGSIIGASDEAGECAARSAAFGTIPWS